MNVIVSRISKAAAVFAALLAAGIAALGGAGLTAVLIRAGVAFAVTWIVFEFLVRQILKSLLVQVLEDKKPSQIDVTLH